jgi:hypothetical protein
MCFALFLFFVFWFVYFCLFNSCLFDCFCLRPVSCVPNVAHSLLSFLFSLTFIRQHALSHTFIPSIPSQKQQTFVLIDTDCVGRFNAKYISHDHRHVDTRFVLHYSLLHEYTWDDIILLMSSINSFMSVSCNLLITKLYDISFASHIFDPMSRVLCHCNLEFLLKCFVMIYIVKLHTL